MVLKLISYFTENMLYIHHKHKTSENLREFIILPGSYQTHEYTLMTTFGLFIYLKTNGVYFNYSALKGWDMSYRKHSGVF